MGSQRIDLRLQIGNPPERHRQKIFVPFEDQIDLREVLTVSGAGPRADTFACPA
jgi:hypothetical protein